MFPIQITEELLTVKDWIRWSASRFTEHKLFFGHGTDNPWDEAAQLVLWVVHAPWEKLNQILDARLVQTEKEQLLQLVERRIKERLPLPYLTGIAYFAGLRFQVSPEVLIPRSPIAELIAAEFHPWLTDYPDNILDLCTGSGCIGIACAMAFQEAEVDLSDISPDALAMAQRNIEDHQLSGRVKAIESDLFESLPGRYDLIVTNPPYVDAEDMATLPPEYQVEPVLALESGSDGLDFTRRLLAQAANHLTDQGVLIVEVGNSAFALEEQFPEVPFTWVEFEHGGEGVFVLTKVQLMEHQKAFSACV